MCNMPIFKEATRLRFRFESQRGNLSVEDLWDLPLSVEGDGVSLDVIAKAVNRDLKASEEESFVTVNTDENTELRMKLDVVKEIIKFKLDEIEENRKKLLNKEKKAKILSIIAEKQDDNLKKQSINSLKKLIEDL